MSAVIGDGTLGVAYLCDKGACETGSCHIDGLESECKHTFDPKHAVFGECKDPWKHPERFEVWKRPGYSDMYWEKIDMEQGEADEP